MNKIDFIPFPDLTTKNLILRELQSEDENEIFALRSDLDVTKYLDRPVAKTIDDARQFINKIKDGIIKNKSAYWAITQKGSRGLIGDICLWNFSDDNYTAEIGYELLPAYQGKGFIQEAIVEVINYAFFDLNLKAIEAVVAKNNIKSIKILERNKFKKTSRTETSENIEMDVYILKKK